MNLKRFVCTLSVVMLSINSACLANEDSVEKNLNSNAIKNIVRQIPKIKTASFTLKDGLSVFGEIKEDDRTHIVISHPYESIIVTKSYSKQDIESRIVYKSMSYLEYWEMIGDYFLTRTWDFKDDPDDFTNAIRSYENAREVIKEIYGPEHEKTKEYSNKISQIEKERDNWIEKTKRRAELKQMEFVAEYEEKLLELKQLIDDNSRLLQQLYEIRQEFTKLESDFDKELNFIYNEIDKIDFKVRNNSADIRTLFDRVDDYNYNRRYYIVPKKESDSD